MTYIHETAILDPGVEIGENTKIWHFTHIMSKAKIGESVSVGQNCFIGDNVVVGNNVKIQNNVSLYDGVIIENDVFVGPSVVFTNVKLPRSLEPVNKDYTKTIIRNGVTLGANSTQTNAMESEPDIFDFGDNFIKQKNNTTLLLAD